MVAKCWYGLGTDECSTPHMWTVKTLIPGETKASTYTMCTYHADMNLVNWDQTVGLRIDFWLIHE
jgi:hypothetical protein